MNQAEEDALVTECFNPKWDFDARWEAIRLAIRAAVAAERERIAQQWDGCLYDSVGEGEIDIAAAIRRGE